MVIGGAINMTEDKNGMTMFGSGGALLFQVLAKLGLHPMRDVYATNIVKCLPPLDKTTPEYKRLDPTEDQLTKCRPILDAQIEIIKPAIIVLHGRQANQALLMDPRPLSKYLGHFRSFNEQCVALSTHNPAGIIKGERASLQVEFFRHWDEVAEKLNMIGRMWRPDAQIFKDNWAYKGTPAL